MATLIPFGAHAASTSVSAGVQASQNFTAPATDNKDGVSSVSASAVTQALGGSAGATATAHSSFGRLSATAKSSIGLHSAYVDSNGDYSVGVDGGFGQAFATAAWYDSIQIRAPGYTGGGYILADIGFSGAVSATGSPYLNSRGPSLLYVDDDASAQVTVSGTGLSPMKAQETWNASSDRLTTIGSVSNQVARISLSSAGTASLGYVLSVSSQADLAIGYFKAYVAAGANGTASFGDTLKWDGIVGVFGANGAPLTGYTVTSDSGFDYTGASGATPESSTWAMMLLGFAGFGFAGYRRRAAAGRSLSSLIVKSRTR